MAFTRPLKPQHYCAFKSVLMVSALGASVICPRSVARATPCTVANGDFASDVLDRYGTTVDAYHVASLVEVDELQIVKIGDDAVPSAASLTEAIAPSSSDLESLDLAAGAGSPAVGEADLGGAVVLSDATSQMTPTWVGHSHEFERRSWKEKAPIDGGYPAPYSDSLLALAQGAGTVGGAGRSASLLPQSAALSLLLVGGVVLIRSTRWTSHPA